MKIVKFKNGKYGVRKFVFLVGWVFAANKSGTWLLKSNQLIQEFDSKEYAQEVLDDMKIRAAIDNDIGIAG
jgi:hypothetical protein